MMRQDTGLCIDRLPETRAGSSAMATSCQDHKPSQLWRHAGGMIHAQGTPLCLGVRDGSGVIDLYKCNQKDHRQM